MTPDQIRQFHLLEMQRAVALIAHENLLADREKTFGGWQYDHTTSIRDLDQQYNAAKMALLSVPV